MRITSLFPAVLLVACARATPSTEPAPSAGPYDVVIGNGKIVDGSGNPWFYGDVAIRGDRIARVAPSGLLRNAPARQFIDARGLVVAPGFIDIQAHSEEQLLNGDSRLVSMVTQGITTAIMGEGESLGPVNDKILALYAGSPDTAAIRLIQTFAGPRGFDAWLRAMETHRASVNIGSFLGAGTVRAYAKGMMEGPASPAELDTMRRVVRDAMLDGAFGIGSALIYPPGIYASTEELIQQAKAMAPYGGIYITHMRSEGDRFVEAVDEALRIGREGGVPVEIYHLKAAGVKNWPKMRVVIARLDSARAAGQDVTVDQYPYTAGSNNLSSCIPPWAHADGRLLDRLRDAETRARIRREMTDENATFESLCLGATPQGVQVIGFRTDSLKKYEGRRLTEIAQAWSKEWPDAVIDLTLIERNRLGQVIHIASDSNIAIQVKLPYMKFGTDAGGWDPDSATGSTHPRSYGTYPRIMGRFVREWKLLTLEDAVRKSTWATAQRLSIPDRGLLREGMFADVVVFDPNTIIDRATYEQPHQLSVGVMHVFVNGVATVSGGRVTGAKPGRIVRGPGYQAK